MYHNLKVLKQHCSKLSVQCLLKRTSSQVLKVKTLSSDKSEDFKIGEIYSDFIVRDVELVPEFSIEAIRLQHQKTKAEYLHLRRNDSNNVFSVNFRTTPLKSTGLPHILEHTVLCGSKDYPVRDPFFKMINRSLANFMNAMTGPDYTMYPFSTTNLTDYKNLQSIYLDAVFRPNLNLLDFMQEGWRLENSDLKNPKSDLIIKGVVYNEMKGAFSENERILEQKLLNSILPDHTYGVISGGDPMEIPKLTWEDLKEFHRKHYHPSNCKFFSYGNFPLLPTLEYLNTKYLKNIDYLEANHTEVPSQKKWNVPKKEHIECRFENIGGKIEKQNTLAISFLMTDINNVYETFLLQFLTELLIKGPNSPFYKSLIEPNISGGYSPATGFENQTKDTIFTISLQGLEKNDFQKIVNIFDRTIKDVIKNGFNANQIESVLHSYELNIKHESANFGLHLLFALTPLWNHNGNIINALKINSLISELKSKMAENKNYLQEKVKKYFKNNNHKLVLTMSPNLDYDKETAKKETMLIKEKVANLSSNEKQEIYQLGLKLQQEQSKHQNLNILPSLKISDINKEVLKTPLEQVVLKNVPTQICEVPTNEITYFKTIVDVTKLTDYDHKMLLPLFCHVISKLGTSKYNYRDFDTFVNQKTSGLSFSTHVAENLHDFEKFELGIKISSYCLDKNISSMFEIWSEIFNIQNLDDVKRFEMLVQMYIANLSHGIADAGHLYAMQAAKSLVSGSGYQKELFSGLKHIDYMKRLVANLSYAEILQKINEMGKLIFDKNNLRSALNVSPSRKNNIVTEFEKFISNLPGEENGVTNQINWQTLQIFNSLQMTQCQHNVLNVPVNYCSKAIKAVPYTNEEFSQLAVLARLLTAKYLHPVVREKNGAYGGGCRIGSDGIFSYYSYRDPNNLKTLDVFDNSHEYIKDNLYAFTEQDIFEAKLGLFQTIDAPVSPANRGSNAFLIGLTDELLQEHRQRILNVQRNQLMKISEKFLSINTDSVIGKVVLGPKTVEFDYTDRTSEVWKTEENNL